MAVDRVGTKTGVGAYEPARDPVNALVPEARLAQSRHQSASLQSQRGETARQIARLGDCLVEQFVDSRGVPRLGQRLAARVSSSTWLR